MSKVFNSGSANAPARKTQQRAAAQPTIQSADGIIEAQGSKHGWITNGPILSAAYGYLHTGTGNLDLSGSPDAFIGGHIMCNDTLSGNSFIVMPSAADFHAQLNASHYLELPTTDPLSNASSDALNYAPFFEFTVSNQDAAQTFSPQAGANSGFVGSATVAASTMARFRCALWVNAGTPSLRIIRMG